MHVVLRIVERGRVIRPTSRFALTLTSSEATKSSTIPYARATGDEMVQDLFAPKALTFGFGFSVSLENNS